MLFRIKYSVVSHKTFTHNINGVSRAKAANALLLRLNIEHLTISASCKCIKLILQFIITCKLLSNYRIAENFRGLKFSWIS